MSKRLRVALLINDMNARGGIQRVAAQMVRDLADSHDVILLTVFTKAGEAFADLADSVQTLGYPYSPDRFYPRLRELAGMGLRLRRFVREQRVDVVICFWFHLACIAALSLPRPVRKIGFEHIAFSAAVGPWRLLRRLAYKRLDAVVSLTHEDAARFAAVARRVEVIPNYVEPRDARADAPDRQILLAVGHVEHRKGIDRLLWALKEPLLAEPDWRLVVVGGGAASEDQWYIQYLAGLVQLLQLDGRVEFHPTTAAIDAWYAAASCYVMGSRLEGLPMVLLEAKAHGLPIVAYDCPTGPREVIREGVDGYLITGEAADFGDAALRLMRDPALRAQMGAAGREDAVERFSRTAVLGRWRKLIASLTE
ncbi:MAG: glycosyltransferase family 4 protein [Acetobacteraceae bacterium]